MEVALTTQDAIHFLSTDHFLSAEPKLKVALLALGLLVLIAALSRQLFSFLGSALLAVMAFSIFAFPDLLPTVLIIGLAAGSLLVAVAGMSQRRQRASLRRELTRLSHIQTRLETAESRRVLADIKSTHSALSEPAVTENVDPGSNVRDSVDDAHPSTVIDLKQSA